MGLSKEKTDELQQDLYSIIQFLKGNDLAITENNLKATIKNLKELAEGISQRKVLPTQEEQDKIAENIANEVDRLLRAKGWKPEK